MIGYNWWDISNKKEEGEVHFEVLMPKTNTRISVSGMLNVALKVQDLKGDK